MGRVVLDDGASCLGPSVNQGELSWWTHDGHADSSCVKQVVFPVPVSVCKRKYQSSQ